MLRTLDNMYKLLKAEGFINCRISRVIVTMLLIGFIWMVGWQKAFSQYRPLGAGLVLGIPSGITGKYWLNQSRAVDGGLAWTNRRSERFIIYMDYILHQFDVLKEERTAFYYGFGGHVALEDESGLAARIPFGVMHLFERQPIEIFVEAVPILRLVPETELDIHGSFGARFYFAQPN